MQYLFHCWDSILRRIGKSNVFIFLDFDGTLAPIASAPEKAVLPVAVRKLLRKASKNPRIRLAIISGRQLEDIKNKIRIKNIIYSGNHGLQLEGPKIKFNPFVPSRYQRLLGKIKCDLRKKTAPIKGVYIEDKGPVLSLHYRLVDKNEIPVVKTIFLETVITHSVARRIKTTQGKMVFEVRPPLEWDKGKIVSWLLARRIFAVEPAKVIALYIGDDTTDEDAFRQIRNKGLAVVVGRPRKSLAQYYVKDHNDVRKFLERIVKQLSCKN